ncbi:anti-sigma28 factor FlgM [uncultured Clostridium sp.]|uniref:flagellar biosynthesis anti-sigma factor FlgM n=1 Tax=uncultured Clostridium sp. TaxID=59620 RepID=UPI00082281DA|nr:flagellar biosynthesis anti-sigma factor FlgM [uncultured Clostridium sp.]SCJ98122.1 anti-sigma28 factor FlgM [uncultured Clostridium sp.]
MKVDSIQRNNMINAYTKQRQNYKSEVVNKLPKDKVTISEDAKYLNKITTENENIDLDKINAIKNRIKQGTYTVDSKKIAEKIIKSIKES